MARMQCSLLTDAFVFSVFPALLPTWSSEATWWSGHRRTQSGAGGGTVEKPRQSSPSAPDVMTSPSVLLSRWAPTSLLTLPSLIVTMEVQVSSKRLLDRPGGFPSLTWLLWSSDWRLCTENPPVSKWLYGAVAAALNLSWDKRESATCGYTVEWCIPGDKDPWALQWMKVPAGSNMLSLPAGTFFFLFCSEPVTERFFFMVSTLIRFCFAGNFKAGCRYTFNIYGCTENGHKLLEIQTGYIQELRECWSLLKQEACACWCFYSVKCVCFPKNSFSESVEAPNLDTFTSESSSVTLEWHYNEDDEAHPAFITGYLVTAQEVQQDALAGWANAKLPMFFCSAFLTKNEYCRVLVGSWNTGVVFSKAHLFTRSAQRVSVGPPKKDRDHRRSAAEPGVRAVRERAHPAGAGTSEQDHHQDQAQLWAPPQSRRRCQSRRSKQWLPLFSARLRPLGGDPHAHLPAAVLHPSAVALEKCVSHCRPEFPQTSKGPSSVPVFLLPSRVKIALVRIFAYPAGMNIRAPDLDSFQQEVQTEHRFSASLHLILR